jgi:prepilin-type processing-associated H-X9-DG protein
MYNVDFEGYWPISRNPSGSYKDWRGYIQDAGYLPNYRNISLSNRHTNPNESKHAKIYCPSNTETFNTYAVPTGQGEGSNTAFGRIPDATTVEWTKSSMIRKPSQTVCVTEELLSPVYYPKNDWATNIFQGLHSSGANYLFCDGHAEWKKYGWYEKEFCYIYQ